MIAVGTQLPRAPRSDPYVPNSGRRLPPRVSDGEACIWPGMEDARFREPILDQPHDPFHRRPIFLASPPQRAPPESAFLNQRCLIALEFESMFRAEMLKILLQQYLPIADISLFQPS